MPYRQAFSKAMELLRTRTPQAADDLVPIQLPEPVDLGSYYFRDTAACPDISHEAIWRIPEPGTGRMFVFESVAEDMANSLWELDQTVYGWGRSWNRGQFETRQDLYDAVIKAQNEKSQCGDESDAHYFRTMGIDTGGIACEDINTFLNGSTVSTLCTMAEYELMGVQAKVECDETQGVKLAIFVIAAALVLTLFLIFEFSTTCFGLVGTNEARKMSRITGDMHRPM